MKFKLRRYYLYYIGRVFAYLFALLPLSIGRAAGAFLGRMAFYLLPKYSGLAIEHLTLAFGSEKSESEIRTIARRMFENLGKNAAELVNFPKINESNIASFVTLRNREILDAAYAKGRGIVVITAHFGNWELMAATLRLNGCPGATIGRRIYFKKYDDFLNYLRRSKTVDVVYRDESPRKMLKVLRENRIMGIVADQDVDSVEGVFIDFFGRPAHTPVGPVALARASGAALIPVLIVRKNGHHEVIVENPIELSDTGDKKADLVNDTKKWSSVVESYIRRYPDQWVWMHRRWKTKQVQEYEDTV